MQNTINLSLIIITKDRASDLENCLNLIVPQLSSLLEVVVVDNASTDQTKQLVMSLQQQYEKIKYFYEPIPGRGRARNLGVQSAKGNYFLFTDDDCYPGPCWIENYLRIIQNYPNAVLFGSGISFQKNSLSDYVAQVFYDDYLNRDLHFITANSCYSSIAFATLMFDARLQTSEDFDFNLKLQGEKIKFDNTIEHKSFASRNHLWLTFYNYGHSLRPSYEKLLFHLVGFLPHYLFLCWTSRSRPQLFLEIFLTKLAIFFGRLGIFKNFYYKVS